MDTVISFFQKNFFVFEIMFCFVPYILFLKADKYTWLKAAAAVLAIVAYSSVASLLGKNGFLGAQRWFAIPSFLILFALVLVGVKLSFKSDIWTCTFCGISAYLTQHIFFRVRMLTIIILSRNGVNIEWLNYVCYWCEMLLVNFFCWLFYSRNLQKHGDLKINNKRLIIVSVASLVVVNFLNSISMFYSFGMPIVPLVAFYLYALLDCVILLYCLYENIYVKSIEDEVKTVHSLWQEDRKRYELSKSSMDLLNMKIHDLKYSISNYIDDETTLKEVSKAIVACDSHLRTNNEVLDVVLSQTKMICDGKGIRFSCIADGKILSGISAGELYSLFCNAIDNAIECLEKVEDAEKKNLSVIVKKLNEMVLIQIENYVPNEVTFVDGLPQTTKANKQNHGFGVKSMSYIVKKYGGYINFSTEDNVFTVEIIFPLNKN